MPPNRHSRYSFTSGVVNDAGKFVLTDRVPYRFVALDDTIVHVISTGDSLWSLAAKTYAGTPRPASFWWAIADFQPLPIIDPTVRLAPGAVIFIPSMRTLLEDILAETRRVEALL